MCIQVAETEEFTHLIIIYNGSFTSSVKKIVEISDNLEIELINENRLKYNITKHSLVPKHTLVTDKSELLELYKLKLSNIPVILKTDPIVEWYNWKPGNIVRIDRHDNSTAYRIIK